jgi:predicted  nucleic acid-binding Zn-ribbon protein
MTQIPSSWHHCGKCGEIYKGSALAPCPACASTSLPARKKINVHTVDAGASQTRRDFNPKLSAEPASAPKLVRIDTSVHSADDPTASRKSSERKRKKSNSLIKFVIAWIIGLILIVGLIKWQFGDDQPLPLATPSAETADNTLLSKNIDIFSRAYPHIMKSTGEFIDARAAESLAPYCRQRPSLAMTIFNDGAKAFLFKPETTELFQNNIIHIDGQPMIETVWQDDRKRKMEIVYAEEDGRWLIDWESYAKSSTLPWSVFQSDGGDGEGTFRMLVRERLAEQKYNDPSMSVVFYEPSFFHGGPAGMITPEFSVDRKSRNGRLLAAALAARLNDKPLFQSIFPKADPPSMARVTVKIRRVTKEKEKNFELVEVLACHWMGIDDLGVELTDSP